MRRSLRDWRRGGGNVKFNYYSELTFATRMALIVLEMLIEREYGMYIVG